jgi:nitric-oxide synthase, bacterial
LNERQFFLPIDYQYIPVEEIENYYFTYQQEMHIPLEDSQKRLKDIRRELALSGTYQQTTEEITFGTQIAWRNALRCVGRLHWPSLKLRDLRHISDVEELFQALVEHIELSTNKGKIQPIVSIFAPQKPGHPSIRIWNHQLIRYAGYCMPNGTIVGDPMEVDFTKAALRLGWKGGERTAFDILPLIIQLPGQKPRLFELPPDIVVEVPISHPEYSWFIDLGLRWYAFPAISNMCLELGGLRYTAAPFSGWYLATEIGARNFADVNRYNMLPVVAKRMGLDTRTDRSLWKDQALLELNKAVLHSYALQKISIIDHHTATRQFVLHEEQEQRAGRKTYADWSRLVPPMSGATTLVYNRSYENIQLKPNWFYQKEAWKEEDNV